MTILDTIYNDTELKGIELENKKAEEVLQEFQSRVGGEIEFSEEIACLEPRYQLIFLRFYQLEVPTFPEIFYDVLSQQGFNTNQELKDTIRELGMLSNPDRNQETIKRLLQFSTIQDISYDNHKTFTIQAKTFGAVSFTLASRFYKDSPIVDYIDTVELGNACFQHTEILSALLPQEESRVSLCQGSFYQPFYHAYTRNPKEKYITDLCFNAVMSEEDFERMQQASPIVAVNNEQLSELESITERKTGASSDFFPILQVALYQQCLDRKPSPYVKKLQP